MVKTQSSQMVDGQMNATWKQFLRKKVNSFIKWDLVRFFHDNPYTADTAANIAAVVGRDTSVIIRELEGLVKTEVLIKERVSGQVIYRLTTETDTRQLIREFVVACHNREFRVHAINQMMLGMGFSSQHSTS